mgnify:CR=1 FL=1
MTFSLSAFLWQVPIMAASLWLASKVFDGLRFERGSDLLRRAPADFAVYSGDDATALALKWQQYLQVSGSDGVSYNVTEADLSNPFGTRRGEVLAWKRIAGMVGKRMGVALA